MLSFLHLCCLWSIIHTHTMQLGIPLSLGLSVFFFLHCPFQIEIIFVNRVVAIASLLLISGVLFPFASILAPRFYYYYWTLNAAQSSGEKQKQKKNFQHLEHAFSSTRINLSNPNL